MPSPSEIIEQLTEEWARRAREYERAQSERVGPSPFTERERNHIFNGARPLSLADLEAYRYVQYRPVRQPESAPQAQGGQMRISSQPDPLTAEERRQVRNFFKEVLTNGYATWPIERGKVTIYINGSIRRIYSDSRWNIGEDYIYIGRSRDEGINNFADPSNRLACTVALMGACEMQNDPELIGLVEKRLAKVLAGVYESAIAPLAQRSNKEPIVRIAWSPAGGVAAWVDGKWASPITGEEVTLKAEEGWVVVETGEGKAVEVAVPPIATSTVANVQAESNFRRLCGRHGWTITHLPDGRGWTDYVGQAESLERVQRAEREGYTGLIAEAHPDGRWGITYPLAAPTAAPVPEGQVLLREDFDRWVAQDFFHLTQTADGRPIVAWSALSELRIRERHLPAAIRIGGPNVEVTQNVRGDWGIAPAWGQQAVPALSIPSVANWISVDEIEF